MSSAITELTDLATASDRFGYSHDDLYPTQLAALDERFQDRRERIKLLRHRIDETETTAIRTLADAVPLLFPHSVYKSYPERFLAEQQWDRLATWLNSLSSHPIDPVETAGIDGIDDWIERLAAAGHHVSCTSGTTGKSAMLIGSDADIDWAARDTVNVFTWGSGIEPTRDRRMVGLASSAVTPRNSAVGAAQQAAFSDPEKERFGLPIPPITVGTLTAMVVLRKKVADGAASPEELATYERTSQQRQAALDKALVVGAEALTGYRDEKLYISGMWNMLYQVAAIVRDMGYSGADFHPGNCIYVAGGRKGAQLPENYQQFVYQTFGIAPRHHFQNYSMQEINSGMPSCTEGGRYHVPPWIVPFVLDESGDTLLPHESGEVEGRAGFFDLSLDGRWGGIITGDKIALDFGRCACGNAGPSVRDTVVRYTDLAGDDKIGCAGTADAYVRGLS